MEERDIFYNDKRFLFYSDFVKEFKPTKWSIRKYMAFIKELLPAEETIFMDYTVEILKRYSRDKDTLNFISQIENKKMQFIKHSLESVKSPSLWTEDPDSLIYIMWMMQKTGIISGTGKELAIFLKNNTNVSYSLSTIISKIYKKNEEFRENFHEKTFKFFLQIPNLICS